MLGLQIYVGGKWHVRSDAMRTACGERIPAEFTLVKDLDLVDSKNKCMTIACVRARNPPSLTLG